MIYHYSVKLRAAQMDIHALHETKNLLK